eukprot:GCRY01003542.1.p1 GENE.GCRY01003542.1~~GCRY01003542.1.p1  ORF type:complete len:196 (+),score=36.46 GCRY01003542.1:186-773(+)
MESFKPEELEAFLNSINQFRPLIPDETTDYYLKRSGFQCSDVRVQRLIAVAAQKFIADVAHDSMQYAKVRMQNPVFRDGKRKEKDTRMVLTPDDVAAAVKEYGVNMRKPDYYVDRAVPKDFPTPLQPASVPTTTTSSATAPTAASQSSSSQLPAQSSSQPLTQSNQQQEQARSQVHEQLPEDQTQTHVKMEMESH